jgi:hypothetical protein
LPLLILITLLGELSRLGSGLILLPATFLALIYIFNFRSKKVAVLSLLGAMLVIPMLRSGVMELFSFIREMQSGIPRDLVPLTSPIGHRLLLGLSFSTSGVKSAGIDGLTWSDLDVFALVSAKSGSIPFSSQYNQDAIDLFFATISNSPVEYVNQLFIKTLWVCKLLELRLLLGFIGVLILFILKIKLRSKLFRLGEFKSMWYSIIITFLLGLTPLLASRPFTLYLFYLKPVSDLILVIVWLLIVNSFYGVRSELVSKSKKVSKYFKKVQ